MSYSPWTVSKPVLWPVVIRDNDFPAVGLCGEPGGEGTLDALRAHPSPAAGDALNLSGPMAFKDYPDTPEPWQSEDEFHGGPCRMSWLTTPLMLIAGLVLILFLAVSGAWAHTAPSGMKYEAYCCNGNNHTGDCQPIPDSSVRVIQGGYQVTLGPGDHRLVTRVHVWQKAQTEVRYSSDGQFHACLYPNENTLRCLYVPPFGA